MFPPALHVRPLALLAALIAAQAAAQDFEKDIRPLLAEFCNKCHSTEKQKGDLDLERFTSFDAVKNDAHVWELVDEQMALGEMPPKDKPQPSPEQKVRLVAWVQATLDALARERAGDPGPVVLRRLSNAEYTHTIRDLTGVASLDPAREFPVDGAAGEGFTNTGAALVMSPALITKYLDAAKGIAEHVVLLPDGIAWSPHTSRRDWTEEKLAAIRGVYREFTDNGGGTAVNLQGIRFDTKDGGVLPLDKYLNALLDERAGTRSGGNVPPGLSAKYLAILRETLSSKEPNLLLDPLRARWAGAKPGDGGKLAEEISRWQHALWKFNSVGHIGKKNGPKSWMEPLRPIQDRQQELRFKMPPGTTAREVTLYLAASDAGDGNAGDSVVWEQPRFVVPGQPPLLLRDVREIYRALSARRADTLAQTAKYLAAAAEVESGRTDLAALAHAHGVKQDALAAWLDYLGLSASGPVKLEGHFTDTYKGANGYDFISGWGKSATPLLAANSSYQHVRIPGNMKPQSVAVHPAPKLAAAIGWRSPAAARVRVTASIQHAHPECGNGVTWSLELRRGSKRQRLANGIAHGANAVAAGPIENLAVQSGDVLSLLIGPRDANHSCDLTAVDLTVKSLGEDGREWDLARDVSPNVTAGNPHADRFGNEGVWHFYTEPDKGAALEPAIPAGSLLAKWQAGSSADEKGKLAEEIQKLLTESAPPKDSPDAALHRQLTSLGGPLFHSLARSRASATNTAADEFALDPAQFKDGNLSVQAPSVIEVRLPLDLVGGLEFVTTGVLDKTTGVEASVQFQLLTEKPATSSGLLAIEAKTADGEGPWYSNNRVTSHNLPIVVNPGSTTHRRIEAAFEEFRQLFPVALCYTKIVPVDEVVTLTLFHREDDHFKRLMLDDAAAARLDRLWKELRFISQDALTLVDVFAQLWQFATQDADPSVFEPMREPIRKRAVEFRAELIAAEPRQFDSSLEFAQRAWRRPLTDSERGELRTLYGKLREQELPHEAALRMTLARVLVAPAFLYKMERPAPGTRQAPVNDWELATRLSYFLWSSAPDAELSALALAGKLREPATLTAQTRRMLRDARVRRLAVEFGCQWLHVRDFETLDEKSERHFPTFASLRGAMAEEPVRFFTDFFQRDASVFSLLDADHTFVNAALAKHYGLDAKGDDWRRVDGVRAQGRGGVLAFAATLAKQSGASRTSPILRGNWLCETLLGERLPRPPKDVPVLPDEVPQGLTDRQLTEKHSSDPKCANCHVRIDPFGFAFERYDAIGALRAAADTRARLADGTEFDGLDGLRDYLLSKRRDAFVKQFTRKLLGFALGRGVQLSDQPLVEEIQAALSKDARIGVAIERIVASRQFREIRGREFAAQ